MPAVKQKGFTLIELIVVIVITGIIAVTSTQFIVNAVKGYSATSLRDKRANTLRITLAKIEQQLSSSIKSSVRVEKNKHSQCIEMLPINASAFYLKNAQATKQLQAIGLKKDVIGKSAILNNFKSNSDIQSIYHKAINNRVIAQRRTPQSPVVTVELTKAIATQTSANSSLVHFTSSAISYCFEKDKLYRYTNYAMNEKQPNSTSLPNKEPYKVLLNQNLLPTTSFDIDAKSQLLKISLISEVNLADSKEQVTLHQQWWLSDE
jgi:MSHA biogenesis protein MshO